MIKSSLVIILFAIGIWKIDLCHANAGMALQKCCPKYQTLSISDLNNYRIVCVPTDEPTIFGYNFMASEQTPPYSPPCAEWTARRYSDTKQTLSQSGCADYVNDHMYVIECRPPAKPFIEVTQAYKCCPEHYSYDLEMHKCVSTPNQMQTFANFFGATTTVLFQTMVPQCNNDNEVFVEYDTNVHDIFLNDGALYVRHDSPQRADEHLPAKTFCLDAAFRSENDDLYESEHTYRLVVRSCRPKNICQIIPCVRRCCRSDQMLEKPDENTPSECTDHPERQNFVPTFHSVGTAWRNEMPRSVNQTGMFLLHHRDTLHCITHYY